MDNATITEKTSLKKRHSAVLNKSEVTFNTQEDEHDFMKKAKKIIKHKIKDI